MQAKFVLSLTTQGPLYPPSEVMDEDGNFIVIGAINRLGEDGNLVTEWGQAIVHPNSELPPFGHIAPYNIIEEFGEDLPKHVADKILHTLPLPLPAANYPMLFAPDQYPFANKEVRPSYPFHMTPIPDAKPEHGRQLKRPVRLRDWISAKGELCVTIVSDGRAAEFDFALEGLIPNSLYTVMALRENDLNPVEPTRPGPLGIPNVLVADRNGSGRFHTSLPNPFPRSGTPGANRIVNVVVLWMSYQLSHGGAIGRYGLGGDIHAQLKIRDPSFGAFETRA